MFYVQLAPLGGILGPLKSDLGLFWPFRAFYSRYIIFTKSRFKVWSMDGSWNFFYVFSKFTFKWTPQTNLARLARSFRGRKHHSKQLCSELSYQASILHLGKIPNKCCIAWQSFDSSPIFVFSLVLYLAVFVCFVFLHPQNRHHLLIFFLKDSELHCLALNELKLLFL